ncbi:hypothetical protein ND926_04415 [Vibrio diabolicus]|uniref:hypothetical protein n=1 Tax=Vibrio harveyi group TaxID=717610 RepID=UPI0021606D7E|nr:MULTISPECIES: hypothetical protein [Vibrio harveyi group]MCS0336705.1 hypothetical protein [Vibrio diabolicus]MCZ6309798.1 hypothetical protein [Vibrio parahaemolyticus]MDG3046417.1 hypothetical protein [Vibrio parahaemolyticus]
MSEVKGKPITKEMWEDIEAEMSGSWVAIAFNYKGHEVSVNRVRVSESKTSLQVYIDGFVKGEWVSFSEGKDGISDKAPAILADVWCKKTKARYDNKFKTAMTKIYGKRGVKKEYPDLDEKLVFYIPNFSKASVLCRQFKKLEGLELKKAMFLDLKEETL